MYKVALLLLFCGLNSPDGVHGHGRLIKPPSRSSMWRFGFKNPTNVNDNQLFCGGFSVQYGRNGGMCGLCGDAYDRARENEAGGRYANGIIVANYTKGSTIDVEVEITAYHKGWSEFRLCKNNDVTKQITQDCLNEHLLLEKNKNTKRIKMTGPGAGIVEFQLQLPADLTCTQCVLQWKYHTGNSWGYDENGGCLGCGDQEEFYGCSDVAINDPSETPSPRPTTTTTTAKKSTTTTTAKAEESTTTTTTHPPATSATTKTPVTLSPTITGKICKAVPGSGATDQWCKNVCNHVPPFCPTSHCICYNAKRSMPHHEDRDVSEDRLRSMPNHEDRDVSQDRLRPMSHHEDRDVSQDRLRSMSHHEDRDVSQDRLRSMPNHEDRNAVEANDDDDESTDERIITLLKSLLSKPYRKPEDN